MLLAALLAVTPAALTGHAGVQVDDKVFVCGGMGLRNEGRFFSEAWLVDPVRGSWEPLPEPKLARGMAAAALLDGSIYLAGGLRWSNGATGAVERFDLVSRRWSSVAALRTPRSRLGLVTILGKLYAVSGMRADSGRGSELNTASIEVYDPGKNTWQSAGSLNHARHGFASVVWRGKLYVF